MAGAGVPPQRPGLRPSLRPSSSSAPSTWGLGQPATWGNASPGEPGRSAPGWLWPHRAPARAAAPTCPLTGPEAPTSSWAPAPAASAFPGPRGQARAGPRGHLRSPKPDPGDGARALPESRTGCGCSGRGPCVLELEAVVFPMRSRTFFYTLEKMFLPVAWISPGYF